MFISRKAQSKHLRTLFGGTDGVGIIRCLGTYKKQLLTHSSVVPRTFRERGRTSLMKSVDWESRSLQKSWHHCPPLRTGFVLQHQFVIPPKAPNLECSHFNTHFTVYMDFFAAYQTRKRLGLDVRLVELLQKSLTKA